MQDDAFNRRFADLYKEQLPRLNRSYGDALLVTFCGVPASGKTTLAKKLARDLGAHRISNDEIRDILRKNKQALEGVAIGQISRKVIEEILKESSNKLIIADSSIDRTWPSFFETAKHANVPTFVIRLNCDKAEIEERLRARGRDDNYIKRHEVFFEQFEMCRRHVIADVELGANYNYDEVLGAIKAKLDLAAK